MATQEVVVLVLDLCHTSEYTLFSDKKKRMKQQILVKAWRVLFIILPGLKDAWSSQKLKMAKQSTANTI